MKAAIVAAVLAGTLAQSARSDVRLPAESAGWDNVIGALLSVFDHADVLALGEHMAERSIPTSDCASCSILIS